MLSCMDTATYRDIALEIWSKKFQVADTYNSAFTKSLHAGHIKYA